MDKDELRQLMLYSNPDQEFLEELQEKLSDELDKQPSERDYDLIEELTDTINLLMGTNDLIEKRSQIGISQIQQINAQNKQRRTKQIIRILTPCLCAMILVLSNIWSYSALGMNSFSAMYQIMQGGITIDFTKQQDIVSESTNPYQDEMNRICTSHNIDAMLPAYIPANYTPTDLFGQVHENNTFCIVLFYFKHKDSTLLLQVSHYADPEEMPPIGIPSDHYNISEQTIDGTTICISKEDQQFTAAFAKGTTQYLLFSDRLDYDECQRILESMFT